METNKSVPEKAVVECCAAILREMLDAAGFSGQTGEIFGDYVVQTWAHMDRMLAAAGIDPQIVAQRITALEESEIASAEEGLGFKNGNTPQRTRRILTKRFRRQLRRVQKSEHELGLALKASHPSYRSLFW